MAETQGALLTPATLAAAVLMFGASTLSSVPSHAQATQSLPGIIIAPAPSPMPGAPGSPQPFPPGVGAIPPPPAPPPPSTAAPKPKPVQKSAPRPRPTTENADAEGIGKGPGSTRISLLVNGEPITEYEIEQRARLMSLGAGQDIQARAQARMKELATSQSVNARWKEIVAQTVNANQGKSREQIMAILQERQKTFSMDLQKQAIEGARASVIPKMRENARRELIEEMVKIQDARRAGAAPDESMVDDLVRDLAQRNKMTTPEFTRHFAGMGVDIMTLKARYRAQLAFTGAVRKQYGHLTQPSQRELDKALVNFSGGEDQVELELQRIVITVPPKLDQRAMAQRLAQAEQVQRQFTNCKMTAGLAAKVQGSRFENLGARNATSFQEPTRSMLATAQPGTMLPPSITTTGIELLAVCGRRVIKAAEVKRNELASGARQETFERLARGHLRKLMDNAIIETR
jgi:peptidyl-prolyl cis-trans isomerase SurA